MLNKLNYNYLDMYHIKEPFRHSNQRVYKYARQGAPNVEQSIIRACLVGQKSLYTKSCFLVSFIWFVKCGKQFSICWKIVLPRMENIFLFIESMIYSFTKLPYYFPPLPSIFLLFQCSLIFHPSNQTKEN